MNISLSAGTRKLLEERMKRGGYASPDDLVRVALETLDQVEGASIEDLDSETQAAIGRGEAQADRGEGKPWEQVREEIRGRFPKE